MTFTPMREEVRALFLNHLTEREVFAYARRSLIRVLRPFGIKGHSFEMSDEWKRDARRSFWLVRLIDGIVAMNTVAPFGWRWDYKPGYDIKLLMPWWVYYPRYVWTRRYILVFRPLVRLGFWQIEEGAYYVDGHWTWAWWRTLEQRFTPKPHSFSARHGITRYKPRSRWERLGWWLQRAIDEMEAVYA